MICKSMKVLALWSRLPPISRIPRVSRNWGELLDSWTTCARWLSDSAVEALMLWGTSQVYQRQKSVVRRFSSCWTFQRVRSGPSREGISGSGGRLSSKACWRSALRIEARVGT